MSLQATIARIGIPVIAGALLGGVGMYLAVDTACKSFQENPWISAVVGGLAGAGGGYMVSTLINI